MRKVVALGAVAVLFGFPACVSSSGDDGGSGGAVGNYQSCSSDAQCPAGQGCDTEGGSLSPGYCTPLCDNDSQCPMGYDCPGAVKNQPGECDDVGSHSGRGICDQFNGAYGPTTCGGTGSGGSGGVGPGSLAPCGSDTECPSGEGCDTEGGSLSPGYCTPLCDNDTQCPSGYGCPGMIPGQPGECDDLGTHFGRGICDQYDGVNGPNTCGSGGGAGGSSGVGGSGGAGGSGGLPPGPVDSACQSCGLSNCGTEANACIGDSTCSSCILTDASAPGCQSNAAVQALLACACSACATECAAYCG